MQFAASFVEYLVSGATALFWLAILFALDRADLASVNTGHVALLLPGIYVLGIFVDSASGVLVGPLKDYARKKRSLRKTIFSIPSRSSGEKGTEILDMTRSESRTAFVVFHSPELGKEIQSRSSRDRIARGAFLNILLFAAAASIYPGRARELYLPHLSNADLLWRPQWVMPIAMFSIAVFSLAIWWRFEYETYRFKRSAVATIRSEQSKQA